MNDHVPVPDTGALPNRTPPSKIRTVPPGSATPKISGRRELVEADASMVGDAGAGSVIVKVAEVEVRLVLPAGSRVEATNE
jgi:hypothetical protein